MPWSRVSFASWSSFISLYAIMAWYPKETNMCAFVTQQPEEVHDVANERVLSVYPQSSASRTLSQSRLLHPGELGPCAGDSSVLQ